MSEQPTIGKLAEALAAAQGEILPALKTSVNPHFKSKFADLAEVWQACRAALSKYKIAIIQCVQYDGKEYWLETTMVHSSGEQIKSKFPLINMKGDMQGFGSAITYAKRYSLSAMVGVVADEDDDGNAASQRPNIPVKPSAQGFDPKNAEHLKAISAKLDTLGVRGSWRSDVLKAMTGKSMQDLASVVELCNPELPDVKE